MAERVTDAADPERCRFTHREGQCWSRTVDGSRFCEEHSPGHNAVEHRKKLYLLAKAQSRTRLAQLSEHEEVKSLRAEIALARMLIEERFNAISSDNDLITAFGPIQTALLTVERLVKSCHAIEQNLGSLLSKASVLELGQRVSQIIIEELEGVDGYEEIVDRINERIVQAIIQTSNKSDEA